MPTAVEITGFHQGGVNVALGDGSVRFLGQHNLQDMVREITTQTSMHDIQVLRITSPGIIAILIGLLVPAAQKVREAAAQPGLGNLIGPNNLLPGTNKLREAAAQPGLGKFLPAVNKVREAALSPGLGKLLPTNTWAGKASAHLPETLNFQPPVPGSEKVEILPYIETSLRALRPYFALDAQVELRAGKVAVGDLNTDALTDLAKLLGVPVLIGAADPGSGKWRGPVIRATPNGIIQKV